MTEDRHPAPVWEHLDFLSPLSGERADRLAAWLAEDLADGTALDVGCGWAELLLRTVALAPAARAVGIDLDAERIEHARELARSRGLADRVELHAADAAHTAPPSVDALVAVGASQVWGPAVDGGRPLDYGAALSAMHAGVRRGGRVLYGEGVWTRPPTPEATAPLSGRDDEFVRLTDLVALARHHGFEVVDAQEATQAEWDAFEAGFTASLPPERAEAQRASYHQGYRGVLGFAWLQLRVG